ncbi:hypothetical protein F2Q69_00050888 [Brassica cretica]|uniref:Uncharacterized protein n=1 Tax=Brassica cretica TaxID=69181 RepID=A0A8S9Q067_BRACR|nr:hypothetical protein F2Q69_00050888 [Brassica cretica]
MHCTGFNEAVKESISRSSETAKGIVIDFNGASLDDLARQGVIDQDKVDSFSTPLYVAEESELRKIIKENVKFTIEAFEGINHPNGEFPYVRPQDLGGLL